MIDHRDTEIGFRGVFFQKVNTFLLWKEDDELLWVLVELVVATQSNIQTAKWCHQAGGTLWGAEELL